MNRPVDTPLYLPRAYKMLETYLVCNFADPYPYKETDEQIAKRDAQELIEVNNVTGLKTVLQLGEEYLESPLYDWRALSNASNRHFNESEEEARAWLEKILSIIRTELEKEGVL